MESSLRFRNNSQQTDSLSHQGDSKISNLTSNVNTDSTITSNSSTTVVMGKDINEDITNNNDITIKPRYLNFEDKIKHSRIFDSLKQREIDSDNDISPVFESPNTLKRNFLNIDKIRSYKDTSVSINSSELFGKDNEMNRFKQKRNINQLRKQLGTPIPLPYIDNDKNKINTKSLNTTLKIRPSVKYVAPIRKHNLSYKKSNHKLAASSTPKPLTMDKLEEKHHIVTHRWRDLLMKNKIKVEDRLKQLKLWKNEKESKDFIVQPDKKIQHPIPANEANSLFMSDNSSNDISTSEADNSREGKEQGHAGFYKINNELEDNEVSILKLQEGIERNSHKLDLIISMLKGHKDKDVIAIKHSSSKWRKLIKFRLLKHDLLWTICIIILLLCQIFVLKYL